MPAAEWMNKYESMRDKLSFQNGRCVNCYWDGSKSEYIKKQNQ